MRNRLSICTFCLTMLFILAATSVAESSVAKAGEKRKVEIRPKNTSQSSEHRIALVIGNSSYRVGALRNPVNDARAIAAALRELDFEVDEQINLSYQEMGRAINRFGKGIRRDSVALFYYAGHGLQVQGNNYLVPVDMDIQDEGEVQFNTVNAGLVLAKMEESKNPMNIVILDACRDNPFARSWKRSSGSRGLAQMDAPVGSFVAYATAPGKTASDGTGANGLYTESLIRQMREPGLKLEDVFKRVRAEVQSKSGGSQIPWESSSLVGDFYFARGSIIVEEPPPPSEPRPAQGRLTIKSNVSDARVYIDGAYEGDTPVSANLRPGTYAIVLKKAGYPDAAENVRVEAGGAKTISIVMEKSAPPPAAESRPGDAFQGPGGMTVAQIPAGPVTMGSPSNEPGRDNDETQHQVTISRPFYMQTTEVTQGQWKRVMGNNPAYFENCGDDCPVEQVSWNDVQEFISRLNRQEGAAGYRLPTEAEWEYAARAGTTTALYNGRIYILGDNNAPALDPIAWYGGNSCVDYSGGVDSSGWKDKQYACARSGTQPVGRKQPNAWGLYDMLGNVLEWCQDWFEDYPSGSVTDPAGPSSGSGRVNRGGGWFPDARDTRAAFRNDDIPDGGYPGLGFRLVRTP